MLEGTDEPRTTHFDMRVVKIDNLYYIQIVSVYDDNQNEIIPFARPITISKTSVEELKALIDSMQKAFEQPVLNVSNSEKRNQRLV